MKIIRIYHRKELVEELKSHLPYKSSISCHMDLWDWRLKHDLKGGPREIFRQFRIKYGIYETF